MVSDVVLEIQADKNLFKLNYIYKKEPVEMYITRPHLIEYAVKKYRHRGINQENIDDVLEGSDVKYEFNEEYCKEFIESYVYKEV